MKILYFNCFAGISGDMTLGALIDLGVDPDYLISELKKLPIADEFELRIYKSQKMGISGTKVDVIIPALDESKQNGNPDHSNIYTDGPMHDDHVMNHSHSHSHDDHIHNHSHDDHDHSHIHASEGVNVHLHAHELGHSQTDLSGHIHRNLASVEAIIDSSTLTDDVKSLSKKIFMEVALAEAKVHDKSLEEVHFHEVGAVDSIVDIVGTAICIQSLNVDRVICSTIELGGGFVKCAHGLIPVPAPATAEILKGVPVHLGRVNYETTTPTGAAILKALVHGYHDELDLSIQKIGCGLGTKDFPIPNVLRVFLAEKDCTKLAEQMMLETNIDDMSPELYDYIETLLFEAGARDVYKTNILMKKGRPAVKLSILAEVSKLEAIKEIIFKETTSLGLRAYPIDKIEIERIFETLQTPYGEVTLKKGYYQGVLVSTKFEYEECKLIAKVHHMPLKELYARLNQLLERES